MYHTGWGHYRPTSKTPFEWRFAGGSMVGYLQMPTRLPELHASTQMLKWFNLCRNINHLT